MVAEELERRGEIQEQFTQKLIEVDGLDVGMVGREGSSTTPKFLT